MSTSKEQQREYEVALMETIDGPLYPDLEGMHDRIRYCPCCGSALDPQMKTS